MTAFEKMVQSHCARRQTGFAAVPTASLKSVFSLLNDWFPIFGARSDGLLPVKSSVSFQYFHGILEFLVSGRFQSAGVGGLGNQHFFPQYPHQTESGCRDFRFASSKTAVRLADEAH